MKTLSIIFYIIGSILLIASCFTTAVNTTLWLGGTALVALIIGCICQFHSNKSTQINYHHDNYN